MTTALPLSMGRWEWGRAVAMRMCRRPLGRRPQAERLSLARDDGRAVIRLSLK